MRISDWSSDVCSSDLSPAWSAAWWCPASTSPTSRSGRLPTEQIDGRRHQRRVARSGGTVGQTQGVIHPDPGLHTPHTRVFQERKSAVMGKGVSRRVDYGGRGVYK